ACSVHNARDLGFGHLVWIDSTLTNPSLVNVVHDARCLLARLVEDLLEHEDDELHRSVVVVEQQDPVEIGTLRLRVGLGSNDRVGAGLAATAVLTFFVFGCFQGLARPGYGPGRLIEGGHWTIETTQHGEAI